MIADLQYVIGEHSVAPVLCVCAVLKLIPNITLTSIN